MRKKLYWMVLGAMGLIYTFSLPSNLFSNPYSKALFDGEGNLLGASVAEDGQWRFPPSTVLNPKFEAAILEFEDRHFYAHPGFNPVSIAKALWANLKAGEVKRGGSTLTMQVIRLARKNKARTYLEKGIEIILATRLELRYSKAEILKFYAVHAPFGGNVVGIEAAAWRYFSRPPEDLSWAEASFLAVLPNAPGLMHPGRNREPLMEKRNRLLHRLALSGQITEETLKLSLLEPLPSAPKPLPNIARHLLAHLKVTKPETSRHVTTIVSKVQVQAERIAQSFSAQFSGNEVQNIAILVAEVETGHVVAYVGNTAGAEHEGYVDMVQAQRSSGSTLKPFLYAAMLSNAELCPDGLLADIPTNISGFNPENFNRTYLGAVPAGTALSKSLNIPAVRMLQAYGISKFQEDLKDLGISSLDKSEGHYGLSLILGGGEVSLWEITSAYASMARSLKGFVPRQSRYSSDDFRSLQLEEAEVNQEELSQTSFLNAGALWHTAEVLSNLARPRQEGGHERFASRRKIAWKTGTSFGHRDAWAIGFNPEYVVGVWVGNADGEGRPGMTGTQYAAPVLFDVFNRLPGENTWFETPFDALRPFPICRASGKIPNRNCLLIDTNLLPQTEKPYPVCTYHIDIQLNREKTKRVTASCYPVANMVDTSWFVLPPGMEWYFKQYNSSYAKVPPFEEHCGVKDQVMDFIYPNPQARIHIPIGFDGEKGKLLAEVAHRNPSTELYWHLDHTFIGSTQIIHEMEISPSLGLHTLTVLDPLGNEIQRHFLVE